MKTIVLFLCLSFTFQNHGISCGCSALPKFFNNIYVKDGINCIAVLDSFSLETREIWEEERLTQTGHFTLIDTLSKMELSLGHNIIVFGQDGVNCGGLISNMTVGDTFLLSLIDEYNEQIQDDTFLLHGCGDFYFNLNHPEYLNWNKAELQERINDITTSTKEVSLSQFITLFPNPTTQRIFIQSHKFSFQKIKIYDNLGKLVLNLDGIKTDSQEIIVANFQAGIYFLQIDTLDGTTYKKFIKK